MSTRNHLGFIQGAGGLYMYEGYCGFYDSTMYYQCTDDFGTLTVGVWPILDWTGDFYDPA